MRILLDENMPRKLLAALVAEGHEIDSIRSLQLQGIDNGALYQFAASSYDLCFTRDAEFSKKVAASKQVARVKLVHVVIPQTRQDEFVQQFLIEFRKTDWSKHSQWRGLAVIPRKWKQRVTIFMNDLTWVTCSLVEDLELPTLLFGPAGTR